MFKSWYKVNAVWHKLLMKKGINFFEKTISGGSGGEEEEEKEEEENYIDERTKHFLLHVTLFALLQIGLHSAFLNIWVEF